MLVTGLIAIPAIEEVDVDARSSTASDRNKGQQGDSSNGGKRNGEGHQNH